jgi:hypothetical protein
MLQPPLELAQELKAVATAVAITKITIVFLIFVVFNIETINCLVEKEEWIYQVIQRRGRN